MPTKSIVLDVQMMLEVLAPLPAIAARKIMSACSTKKKYVPLAQPNPFCLYGEDSSYTK